MAFGAVRGTLVGSGASVLATSTATGSVAVSAGDLVVAAIAEVTTGTATAVTDNLGGAYTSVGASSNGRLWYKYVTASGTLTTISFTCTASANDYAIVAGVFEGPFTSTPLDKAPGALSDIATPFTSQASTVLSQADELIVGVVSLVRGQTDTTATAPLSLVLNRASGTDNASNTCSMALGAYVVSATTSVSISFAATGTITTGFVNIATFRRGTLPVVDGDLVVTEAADTLAAQARSIVAGRLGTLYAGRASPATYFDASRNLQTAATDVQRYGYDQFTGSYLGTIIEAAGTNLISNPRAEGAVNGVISSGGAFPAGWGVVGAGAGITYTVSNQRVVNNVPLIDIRFSGTMTDAGYMVFSFGGFPAVGPNLPTTFSFNIAIAAGSTTNVGVWSDLRFDSYLHDVNITNQLSAALIRTTSTYISPVGNTYAAPCLLLTPTIGLPIDITLTLGLPQLETVGAATTYILPPVGVPGISARAADVITLVEANDTLTATAEVSGSVSVYLVASFTAAGDRNNFTGYVGATFHADSTEYLTFNRIGVHCTTDNTGLHTVHLYDWPGNVQPLGTSLRTAQVDLTGGTPGNWYYAEIPEITLIHLNQYLLFREVTVDGQFWSDNSVVTLIGDLPVNTAYAFDDTIVYEGAANYMYGGVDLGFISGGAAAQDLTTTNYTDPDTFKAHTVGRGSVNLTETRYADPDTFKAHTVSRGAVTLNQTRYADPDTFKTAVIGRGPVGLTHTRYADLDTFKAHTVGRGSIGLQQTRYADLDTFTTGSIIGRGPVGLLGTRYADPDTFGTAVVGRGSVSLAQTKYIDPDTFKAHTVSIGAANLAVAKYADPDVFPSSSIGRGPVGLLGTRYADPDTFKAHTVNRGSIGVLQTRYADLDLFGTPSVVLGPPPGTTLTTARYVDPDTFQAHIVGRGPVGLVQTRYVDPDTFKTGIIIGLSQALRPFRYVDPDAFGTGIIVGTGPVGFLHTRYLDPDLFYTYTITAKLVLRPARHINSTIFYNHIVYVDLTQELYAARFHSYSYSGGKGFVGIRSPISILGTQYAVHIGA